MAILSETFRKKSADFNLGMRKKAISIQNKQNKLSCESAGNFLLTRFIDDSSKNAEISISRKFVFPIFYLFVILKHKFLSILLTNSNNQKPHSIKLFPESSIFRFDSRVSNVCCVFSLCLEVLAKTTRLLPSLTSAYG